MSQDRVRLLEHIVYQHFGPVVGEIASILLARGSLSFAQLTRLSSLPPSLIQQALLVLSIHTLLYHSESEVGEHIVELYEMNEVHVEQRMRGALYIDMAHRLARSEHSVLGQVIETMWKQGMMSTPDLIQAAKQAVIIKHQHRLNAQEIVALTNGPGPAAESSSASSSVKTKVKGKAKALGPLSDAKAEARAITILKRAFDDGYIAIITPESQNIPSSLEITWEAQARIGMKGIPSAKEAKEMKQRLEDRKEEWFEEQKAKSKGMTLEQLRESYRTKKRTIRYDEDNMDDETEVEEMRDLPPNAAFRINAERFHMIWRSETMERFATDMYNPQIGRVFGLVLQIVDPSTHAMDQTESRSINRTELLRAWEALPASEKVILRHAFGEDPCIDRAWGSLVSKKDGDLLVEALYVLSKVDDLGVNATAGFLRQQGDGPGAKWAVRYADLGARMKRALVEAIVQDKLDAKAIKCWRILDAKGKLDEKHLARLAFLTVKDARETLARLSSLGLIEAQEVPRSADRAPSRTFFLWYVDYPKVITTLLDHQYKALANLQVQKAHQLDKKKALVEKRERSDVRADPKLLTARDREMLGELDKLMEALTVAEMRIDRQVFVLRELDR